MGSMRAARHAGTRQAAAAESSKVKMTTTNTVTSSGLVPNSTERISRVTATLALIPSARPISAGLNPSWVDTKI